MCKPGAAHQVDALLELTAGADAELVPSFNGIDLSVRSFVHSPLSLLFYVADMVRNLREKPIQWNEAICSSDNLECFQIFIFPAYQMWFG